MRVPGHCVTASATGGGGLDPVVRGHIVVNLHGRKRLAAATRGSAGGGAQVQAWAYGAGTDQQWHPVQNADGSYHCTPRNNTNNCLNVTNVSTSDGTRLQQWSCTGGVAQQFTVQ